MMASSTSLEGFKNCKGKLRSTPIDDRHGNISFKVQDMEDLDEESGEEPRERVRQKRPEYINETEEESFEETKFEKEQEAPRIQEIEQSMELEITQPEGYTRSIGKERTTNTDEKEVKEKEHERERQATVQTEKQERQIKIMQDQMEGKDDKYQAAKQVLRSSPELGYGRTNGELQRFFVLKHWIHQNEKGT